MLPAERRKALGSLETVFERPGVTAQDVLATKTHTDAVLETSSEKVRSIPLQNIHCRSKVPWVLHQVLKHCALAT